MSLPQLKKIPGANTDPGAHPEDDDPRKEDGGEEGAPHPFKSQAKEIPSGTVGKLVVYKSGKMRMKIGAFVYDVAAGADCSFLQNVVAVDIDGQKASVLGDISKRFVVSPNVDLLLSETKEK